MNAAPLTFALLSTLPNLSLLSWISTSFGRKTFVRQTFVRQTFGRQTFGQQTFGRQTFGRQTFGRQSFGRQTFGRHSFAPFIWSTVCRVDQTSVGEMVFDQMTFNLLFVSSNKKSRNLTWAKCIKLTHCTMQLPRIS